MLKKIKLVFYIVQHLCLFINQLFKGSSYKRKLRKMNKKAGIKKIK